MRPYLHQQIRAFSNKLVSLICVFQILSESRISETSTVFGWFDLRISETMVSLIRKFADSLPYVNFLWIINVTKRCSLLIFDVLFSMLVNVGCTIHRTFLWNAFDVLYIENSTYCIFSDRCIRPVWFIRSYTSITYSRLHASHFVIPYTWSFTS